MTAETRRKAMKLICDALVREWNHEDLTDETIQDNAHTLLMELETLFEKDK